MPASLNVEESASIQNLKGPNSDKAFGHYSILTLPDLTKAANLFDETYSRLTFSQNLPTKLNCHLLKVHYAKGNKPE